MTEPITDWSGKDSNPLEDVRRMNALIMSPEFQRQQYEQYLRELEWWRERERRLMERHKQAINPKD